MEPIPFTQNFAPLGDNSPSVASYERSSTMESQTAVEDPPARFAISPQDTIKSDYVTFPSFPEPEEPGVPEIPEMPNEPSETVKALPCPSCFAGCLSCYPRQKKEKAIKVPTRSRTCCKKFLSLFSRRSKRKIIQDPAPSSSYYTTLLSLFSCRSKRKTIQDPAPSPSCSPAFAACCVRRNKGKAREGEPLLHPSPFVARRDAATKALASFPSNPQPQVPTTDFAGPSRAQQFETTDEAVYLAGLSCQSNMASDEMMIVASPRHMLPDMAHDDSSKRKIQWDLWYSFCGLLRGKKSAQVPNHSPPNSVSPNDSTEYIAGPSDDMPEVADDNSELGFGSELLASFWSFFRNGCEVELRGPLARRRRTSL